MSEKLARIDRLSKIAKIAAVATGLSALTLAANLGCNIRGDYQSSSPNNLHGHGYDIDPSSLGPNILRLTGRATTFPLRSPTGSLNRARKRVEETCGPLEDLETATERSGGLGLDQNIGIAYVSVPNRLACFPQG